LHPDYPEHPHGKREMEGNKATNQMTFIARILRIAEGEKGQVWAPEGGDEPYKVKLQTDGISTKQHS